MNKPGLWDDVMAVRIASLTSCLNPKVDLALRRVGDGVAAKVHIHTNEKQEGESEICYHYRCLA